MRTNQTYFWDPGWGLGRHYGVLCSKGVVLKRTGILWEIWAPSQPGEAGLSEASWWHQPSSGPAKWTSASSAAWHDYFCLANSHFAFCAVPSDVLSLRQKEIAGSWCSVWSLCCIFHFSCFITFIKHWVQEGCSSHLTSGWGCPGAERQHFLLVPTPPHIGHPCERAWLWPETRIKTSWGKTRLQSHGILTTQHYQTLIVEAGFE